MINTKTYALNKRHLFIASLYSESEFEQVRDNCRVELAHISHEGRKETYRCRVRKDCKFKLVCVVLRGQTSSTGSFHLYEKGEHNHAIGRIRPVVEQELKDVKPTAAEISTPILQPLQSINNCNTLPTSGVYNYLQTFSTLAELEFYRADKTLYSAIVSAAGNKRTYSCPVTVCPESGEKCPYALVAFRNAKNFVCYERGEHRHPKNGANTLSVMRNADVKEEIEDVGPEIAVERVVKEEMMEVTKDETVQLRYRLSSDYLHISTVTSLAEVEALRKAKHTASCGMPPTHKGVKIVYRCVRYKYGCSYRLASICIDESNYQIFERGPHNCGFSETQPASMDQETEMPELQMEQSAISGKQTLAERLRRVGIGGKAELLEANVDKCKGNSGKQLARKPLAQLRLHKTIRRLREPVAGLPTDLLKHTRLRSRDYRLLDICLHNHEELEAWRVENNLSQLSKKPGLRFFRCCAHKAYHGFCRYKVLALYSEEEKDQKISILEKGEHNHDRERVFRRRNE